MKHASSPPNLEKISLAASRSLYGARTVSAVTDLGTPGLDGRAERQRAAAGLHEQADRHGRDNSRCT